MRLAAIDPGNEQSALVIYDTELCRPTWFAKDTNDSVLFRLRESSAEHLAVEMVASYGMAVGATVFETCVWIGRFIECWKWVKSGAPHELVYRLDCKMHLCHDSRAKDTNVRQALMDRYGGTREKAIGRKATPGVLYGLSGDCWSALAVAVTAAERQEAIAA